MIQMNNAVWMDINVIFVSKIALIPNEQISWYVVS